MIFNENVSVCHPDRIGLKLSSLQCCYKEAVDIVHQSGEGLEGDEHEDFFERLKTAKYKWYGEFNKVFSNRTSTFV